jgi:transcriptional regulator with PAS, ATPase and Fis domain
MSENYSQIENRLRQECDFSDIIGHDSNVIKILELIHKVKDIDIPVLIEGESGVGKELIVRAIHYNSKRKKEPLIFVNCGAIPDNLLESEFFGHEKGAFTGANNHRRGYIDTANNGTIFLDEIDDFCLSLQVKLLHVFQSGEFIPVGSSTSKRTTARFIAASKHNLTDLVDNGMFRDDLYYRLNVLRFYIPPLRQRKADIPILCEYFLEKHCQKIAKKKLGITPQALDVLMGYGYPGNVRELENILRRAIILCEGVCIDIEHLPFDTQELKKAIPLNTISDSFVEAKQKVVENFEKEYLLQMLKESQGVIRKAAKKAGMYEANFRRKMKKYGIAAKDIW